MKKFIFILIIILSINIQAFATSYTKTGNTWYGSNGNSYTKTGSTVYGSNGTNYTKTGNTVYSSNGTSYTKTGNTVYSSDGRTFTKTGNTVYSSDGRTFTKTGNSIYISGEKQEENFNNKQEDIPVDSDMYSDSGSRSQINYTYHIEDDSDIYRKIYKNPHLKIIHYEYPYEIGSWKAMIKYKKKSKTPNTGNIPQHTYSKKTLEYISIETRTFLEKNTIYKIDSTKFRSGINILRNKPFPKENIKPN